MTLKEIQEGYQFLDPIKRKENITKVMSYIQKHKNNKDKSQDELDSLVFTIDGKVRTYPNTPSGLMELDLATGIGGFATGRIFEFYGPESSGKTATLLNQIAQVQKRGGIAALIDLEHALDPKWAKKLGVNLEELIISQPFCGEEALDTIEQLIETKLVSLIGVDSVAALVPKAELEKDSGEVTMGLQARLMSQMCRKLTGLIAKSGCTVIFINQLREKIGVTFGNSNTTTGGNALKFYASARIEFKKGEPIKKGEEIIGLNLRMKFVKNKMAAPFTECTVPLNFKNGFDYNDSIITSSIKYKVIIQKGAWYYLSEDVKFQGLNELKQFLKDNPNELILLRDKINSIVKTFGLSDEEIKLVEEEKRKRVLTGNQETLKSLENNLELFKKEEGVN